MSLDTAVVRTTPSDAPWTVTDRREKLHTGGSLFTPTSFHFVVGNKEFDVAAIFGDGFANRGLAEANARLVAAAPALLDALRDAEKTLRWAVQEARGRVRAEIVNGWAYHADKAYAAIVKAEGGVTCL